jgi:hypothetical protein
MLGAKSLMEALLQRARNPTVAACPLGVRGKGQRDQSLDCRFVRLGSGSQEQAVRQRNIRIVQGGEVPTKKLPVIVLHSGKNSDKVFPTDLRGQARDCKPTPLLRFIDMVLLVKCES